MLWWWCKTMEQARRLISLGVEKISVNSSCIHNPDLIKELVGELGSQSVVGLWILEEIFLVKTVYLIKVKIR